MTAPVRWRATVRIERSSADAAGRLLATLVPEAARDAPRASARVRRRGRNGVEIELVAGEAGALRAALNTFLGWLVLAGETERAGAPRTSTPKPL